ncbi:MAG: phytanoyl-CoA dioxygenase family protein [Gammaproteobacteria bacterium]|nr:phytanoyl-CoA dioxygenase family protein [Gammaproteobacteria bacterium]
MPKRLSKSQVNEFQQSGFITGLPLLAEDACDRFRAETEAFEAGHPEAAQWAVDIKANLLFDWVFEFSVQHEILDAIEDLIGPNILLTNSIFRIKEPRSSTHYGWHQDAARIQVDPHFVITYLAIDEATVANGCLRIIPGSHRTIESFKLVSYACDRKVARVVNVDESKAVDIVLNKGEVAIFHGNTIHGSGPNHSNGRRFALINDYTPANAKQSVGQGSGQLVRGEDNWNHFATEPIPVGSFTENNILARRNTLYTYPENVLMGPLDPGQRIAFADEPGAAAPI